MLQLKRPRIVWLVIVTCCLVVVFVYTFPLLRGAGYQRRELERAFGDYAREIKAHDYQSAYDHCDSAFDSSLSLDGFAQQQHRLEISLGPFEASTIDGIRMRGHGEPMRWIGFVAETRRYAKGQVHFLYELHLEEGRWKIFGYKQLTE